MNNKMPRTPLSTPLSGSARETELRLNIFSGPKKRPPLLFLALMCAVCLLCGNLVSCQTKPAESAIPDTPGVSLSEPEGPDSSEPKAPPLVEEWLNYFDSPDSLPWDSSFEIELPEYPDVTFRWTVDELFAITAGPERTLTRHLFSGAPIWNVFFCDLNGDGLRELCAVISDGEDTGDCIKAYDYAAQQWYVLRGTGQYSYTLSLKDGQLQVTRFRYQGQVLGTGRLALEYGMLRMVDEEAVFDGSAPDLGYLLLREHDIFPYESEYMISQLLLTQKENGYILALALVNCGVHQGGLGNLMLGLWSLEMNLWGSPVYIVGGDDGLYTSWTAADGTLHILCSNTTTYQGIEGGSTAAHYRFDGQTLKELVRWDYDALDFKAVPVEGGFELYRRNPQYDLQIYNPEYNGEPLPDQWVYSHFEPVSD